MDERDLQSAATSPPDEEEAVRRLLTSAGPRPPIPQGDLDAIASAARLAWQREVRRPGRGGRDRDVAPARWRRPALVASLAAALAVAIGLAWWASKWSVSSGAGPTVAWVEAVTGAVQVEAADGEPRAIAEGEPIPLGATLRSGVPAGGHPGRASLRLADGTVVRLDVETRLRLLAASTLELERGALYLDTGAGQRPRPTGSSVSGVSSASGVSGIEVRTPVGTARDVGTRFAVRIVGAEERAALLVRVRDGAVLAEQEGRAYRTEAGQELVLHRDGTAERRGAAPYGPEWQWVMEASAGFDVEGRTLAEFLDWVSRETGWRVVLADPGLAESAAEIVLHGGIGELRPDQAPFAVLPGAGLEGELADGTLTVRPRR